MKCAPDSFLRQVISRLDSWLFRSQAGRLNLRTRIASGILWTFVAATASQAGALLRAAFPAKVLGIETYGQFVSSQSLLTMVASFAGMGLGTTATRYVSRYRGAEPARAGRILGLCNIIAIFTAAAFSILLVIFASDLAVRGLGDAGLAAELRVGAVYVFFFTISGYQAGALAGFEAFSSMALATVTQAGLAVVATVILTSYGSLPGAVLSLGVTALISWLFQTIALDRTCRTQNVRVTYLGIWSERRILSEFALPAAISGFIGGVVVAGSNALLVHQPGGLVQAALFGVATTIRTIVLFAPSLLTRVALPILSNLESEQANASFRKTFLASFSLSTGFAVLMALSLVLATPLLLQAFGEEYIEGKTVVVLALLSAVVEVVGVNLFQVLYSHGRVWTHLAIVTLWGAVVLGITYVGAPQHGASALALAYVLAWLTSVVLYAWVAGPLLSRLRSEAQPDFHET